MSTAPVPFSQPTSEPSANAGGSDRGLVTRLQLLLKDELAALLARGQRVALVDYPYSRNSGDAMIWRGERAVLSDLDVDVVYTCETEGYRKDVLAARLGGDGVVLLHGGGNFGDYWPQHQRFRERVLVDFPDHRVVQLPQSIGLRDPASAEVIHDAMAWHHGFTLLVRDRNSLHVAQEELGLAAHLVPDAAFGAGPLTRPVEPTADILVLARTDHERRHQLPEIDVPGATVADWTLSPGALRRWKLTKVGPRLARQVPPSATTDRVVGPVRDLAFESLARQTTASAHRQLSAFRVVVTDRLHAHVMSMMLDIPHVVLDNDYGKIRALHDAWTSDSNTTYFADDLDEAAAKAISLARR
jgi:pyruvyl transferase EpsO